MTILGWIAMSQIRHSAGRLYGLGLAVFDGLLFPLLVLDAVISRAWVGLAAFMTYGSPSGVHFDGSDPRSMLILNKLQHSSVNVGLLATVVTAAFVDFLIIRAVWRMVKRAPSDPAASGPGGPAAFPLGRVAIAFAVLSGISAVIWIFSAGFETLTMRMSPTEARSAIELALKQEIMKHLTGSSERFTSLSVALDSELKTAAVHFGGLQEMRGIEGRNVWVDIDGSLNVLNDGGNWIVQGDGRLGFIKFTVHLEDLTRTAAAAPNSTAQKRSRFPQAAHFTREAGTVLVHHDGVDLHYVLFATKAVGSSVSDQHNTDSLAWRDHGSFKVTEEQTFGYDRESTDPFHLQINGKEYDLRSGRVLVTHDDGAVEQLKLFPSLATASSPEELARLIASARAMNEEPKTVKVLRQQLKAAEAQLDDLLKSHTPTHRLVVEVRESIEALKRKIAEQTQQPVDAAPAAPFGPTVERTLAYHRSVAEGHDVLRLSDGAMSRLPTGFFDRSEQANHDWLIAGGSKIFPGLGIFPDEPPGPHSWGFGSADVEFAWLPDDAWNNPTTERLHAALDDKNSALRHWLTQGATVHCLSPVAKWPATLAFRAGDGSTGLLQILEINDADPQQPIQMKIRYKLAQPATTPPSTGD